VPNAGVPAKTVAGMFALAGFAVAMIAGIAAGNTAMRTLLTAVVSMIVCHVVGVLAAAVLDRVVREHLTTSSTAHAPKQEPAPASTS